jgi:hypothetical protein
MMEELLEQMHDLLRKHNATIVRSADEKNKLVLSIVHGKDGKTLEEEFEGEIGATSIANGWHETI